jgi:archaellin
MSLNELIDSSLDEVLTRGYFKKEVKLTNKLNITLTTISGEDLTKARMSIPDKARKEILTYSNAEKFEILARAIIEINGSNVLEEAKKDLDKGTEKELDAEKFAIQSLRTFLGKLPPKMLDYLSEEYNELAKQQSDYIKNELGDDVENF